MGVKVPSLAFDGHYAGKGSLPCCSFTTPSMFMNKTSGLFYLSILGFEPSPIIIFFIFPLRVRLEDVQIYEVRAPIFVILLGP